MRPFRFAAAPLLAGACLALAACGGDGGTLTGPSLAVDPCRDGEARTFAPVDMGFDRASWFRQDGVATLELRRGWRDPNASDQIALEFSDLAALQAALGDAPGSPLPFDGRVRVALVLRQSCPDGTQPLEAREGTLELEAFDLGVGGRVAGAARFDLRDGRAAADTPPAGEGLRLEFHVALTEKDPDTGDGRK